jgi:Arc/MetJ family transcription regulator
VAGRVGRVGRVGQYIRDGTSEIYWRAKEAGMTKTLIDVDDEQLTAAAKVLNTETKKDTVNAALRMVTALAARRRDLQRLSSGGLPDLADEDVMRAAWQR